MGLNLFSSSSREESVRSFLKRYMPSESLPRIKRAGNPDPKRYQILKSITIGDFLIIKIHYPDCTNYEGMKILMFKGVLLEDLLYQKTIDPHFFTDKFSPIARFAPTKQGWSMARKLANVLL